MRSTKIDVGSKNLVGKKERAKICTYIRISRFGGPVVLLERLCISSFVSLCRSITSSCFRFLAALDSNLAFVSIFIDQR